MIGLANHLFLLVVACGVGAGAGLSVVSPAAAAAAALTTCPEWAYKPESCPGSRQIQLWHFLLELLNSSASSPQTGSGVPGSPVSEKSYRNIIRFVNCVLTYDKGFEAVENCYRHELAMSGIIRLLVK